MSGARIDLLAPEPAVLGCIFRSPENYKAARRFVRPAHFADSRLRSVWFALEEDAAEHGLPDYFRVRDRLSAREWGCIEPAEYEHLGEFPSGASIHHYVRKLIIRSGRETLRVEAGNGALDEDVARTVHRLSETLAELDAAEEGGLGRQLVARSFESIPAQETRWLWPGWVPAGMLALLDGDPGLGKTSLLLDLAARVSRGLAMPDGSPGVGPAGVVIVSAEDDPNRTLRPRLDAAGAEPSRVFLVSIREDDADIPISLPLDVGALEEVVAANDVRLVILDPLMALLASDVNSYRDQDVRRALAPLSAMANRTDAAVIVIRHLNKSGGANAKYRGGGSIGIIGAARAALLVAEDPEDPDRRILAGVKCNLAPTPESLTFRLVTEDGSSVARVEWEGASSFRANDLLAAAAESGEDRTARDEAMAFLEDLLILGPIPANEVRKQARRDGFSDRTIDRAKSALGIVSKKTGRPGSFQQEWCWCLPKGANGWRSSEDSSKDATDARSTPPPEGGDLRGDVAIFANSTNPDGSPSARSAPSGDLRDEADEEVLR